jgi:hypothetical protein
MQTEFNFMKRMQKEKNKAIQDAEKAKAAEAAEKKRQEEEALATPNLDRIAKYSVPASIGYAYKLNPANFSKNYFIVPFTPEEGGMIGAWKADHPATSREFSNFEEAAAYIITLMEEDGVPV